MVRPLALVYTNLLDDDLDQARTAATMADPGVSAGGPDVAQPNAFPQLRGPL
ncbi:hypothetical protein GCM10023176_47930 [Micromonospora coerulea]|uniref:Uncharacterized protein n=1 Tax=Micromonospora coerulea TaxID=47856 RepID=A0ABP8SZW5_9ACTN